MAVISPGQSSQFAIQDAVRQLKIQQARQSAARAESTAQALAGKAADAQRVADRAEENARNLTVQASQAKSVAGQARQGVALQRSVEEMQASLYTTAGQVNVRLEASSDVQPPASPAAVTAGPEIPPVMNTSGQLTGTVVNTTA